MGDRVSFTLEAQYRLIVNEQAPRVVEFPTMLFLSLHADLDGRILEKREGSSSNFFQVDRFLETAVPLLLVVFLPCEHLARGRVDHNRYIGIVILVVLRRS